MRIHEPGGFDFGRLTQGRVDVIDGDSIRRARERFDEGGQKRVEKAIGTREAESTVGRQTSEEAKKSEVKTSRPNRDAG